MPFGICGAVHNQHLNINHYPIGALSPFGDSALKFMERTIMTLSTLQPLAVACTKTYFEIFGCEGFKGQSKLAVSIFEEGHPCVPKIIPNYQFREDKTREVMAFLRKPRGGLYIFGPTGSGKTSLIRQINARLNWPTLSVTCTGRTEFSSLVGGFQLVSEQPGLPPSTKFVYGPLAIAAKIGGTLILNEWDLVDPSETMGLNDLQDGSPLIIAENGGEVIYPHPSFRIIATGNSNGTGDESGLYQGVRMQNMASMDRWEAMFVDYMDNDQEIDYLLKLQPKLTEPVIKLMVKFASAVRSLHKGEFADDLPVKSRLNATISTRCMEMWADLAQKYKSAPNPLAIALDKAVGLKCLPEERIAIHRLAKDIFGDSWGE